MNKGFWAPAKKARRALGSLHKKARTADAVRAGSMVALKAVRYIEALAFLNAIAPATDRGRVRTAWPSLPLCTTHFPFC